MKVLALSLLFASSAQAGPLELEAGPSAVVFDTPEAAAVDTRVATAVTATLSPDAKFPVGIRLHASIGRQGSGLRSLGFALQQKTDKLVVGTGIGVASAVGVVGEATSESLRPRGLGIALDVRLGYRVGPIVLSAFALPTYILADDSAMSLRSVVEAGISVGATL